MVVAERPVRIAILDDYQRVALGMADWSVLEPHCRITVFDRHIGPDEAAETLAPFHVICHLRERMPMPGDLIRALPNLRLIAISGLVHRTLDLDAATAAGIPVLHSEPRDSLGRGTPELAWGLILSLFRHIPREVEAMRRGGWQHTVGRTLYGKTLGILGLGKLGAQMARVGNAFGMDIIAWSQNLTADRAAAAGALRVEKDELFERCDVLTIHLVLGDRTRGLVGPQELARMKPGAVLVNTSRGPIVDEAALIAALEAGSLAGAALDVYDLEPLPDNSPLRRTQNLLLSPHLGYCTEESYRAFYGDMVENIAASLAGKPIRLSNSLLKTRVAIG